MPNAVNLNLYEGKKRFLSFEKEVVLITVGRIVKEKNHLFLVEVVEYLKIKGIKIKLIILGSGALRDQIKYEIEKRKLQKTIEIPGAVDQVENWLKKAHIYVHSSLSETFGLSILEAMASGLPCVVLDAVGNRELVKDGINGFLLENAKVEIFGDKIVELIKCPFLYSKMANESLSLSKNYCLNLYMDKLENFYKKGIDTIQEKK